MNPISESRERLLGLPMRTFIESSKVSRGDLLRLLMSINPTDDHTVLKL